MVSWVVSDEYIIFVGWRGFVNYLTYVKGRLLKPKAPPNTEFQIQALNVCFWHSADVRYLHIVAKVYV